MKLTFERTFNNDLLEYLMEFFPFPKLCALREVCKKLRELAQKNISTRILNWAPVRNRSITKPITVDKIKGYVRARKYAFCIDAWVKMQVLHPFGSTFRMDENLKLHYKLDGRYMELGKEGTRGIPTYEGFRPGQDCIEADTCFYVSPLALEAHIESSWRTHFNT